MTDNMEIVKRSESKIAAWGDRAEVREIARRVQLMAPGAKKLSENEALALAQGAVAHGLDPFNGEIWYIPGSGLMAGIKGLRKAARQQISGNYWCDFEEIQDPDDRGRWMIPQGALAYRCILRDNETITAYSEAFAGMNKQNVPLDVILEVLGRKPYTVGIGYADPNERSKMSTMQLAMKRAEADATKRRFDLPFVFGGSGEAVEGEWSEVVAGTPGTAYPVEEEYEAPEPGDSLFQEERAPEVEEPRDVPQVERKENQWETNVVDTIMALEMVKARPHAINRLNVSVFFDTVSYGSLKKEDAVAYMLAWDVAISEKLETTPERAEYANEYYQNYVSKAVDLLASLD